MEAVIRTHVFLCFLFGSGLAINEWTINAVIIGRKGEVNMTQYSMIADALQNPENTYCRINFSTLEYDQTNGSTLYESLKLARDTFSDETIAVAIGPQIDVFTSTDYVMLHQIHFVTSSGHMMDEDERTMPILPDPKSLSTAIAKIAKYLKWDKVAFLSQEDFSPVLALGGESVIVTPIRLPTVITSEDNSQLQQTLTTLRESQMDRFILHSMDIQVVQYVLRADFDEILETNNIHGRQAKVYGLQLLNLEKYPPQLDNLFGGVNLSRLQRAMMHDVYGILDHYLSKKDCTMEPANNESIKPDELRSSMKIQGNRFMGALGDYSWPSTASNIRTDYTIPIFRYTQSREKFSEVFFGAKETSVIKILSNEEPVVLNPLEGQSFDVIAKTDEPFVMKTADGHYEGFCVDVLKAISSHLDNFKFTIFELDEDNIDRNGQSSAWDDIITQLKVGNASMAIGAFAVTAEREVKISFSYTIISSAVSLLLKRPPDTVNFFQFLGPFSTRLWLMIVLFVLVVGLGLFFMARFDSTQDTVEVKFDLKESMWYSLCVLLQGTSESTPQTTSMRTIVAFFWFCTLVINAAYTANLAAFLTLQQIDNRIKTVDELARQSSVKYGVLNNSDLMYFFKNSREFPYERMWTFMKLNEDDTLLASRSDGVTHVLEKEYAYLDDAVINNYNAQKNCEVESIEQNFGVKHFSMGFPKGAPYRVDINTALLSLKEDGTLDKLRDKWWSSGSNCTNAISRTKTKVNTASELNIDNMFGVFIVLIVFTVLAILYEIGFAIWRLTKLRQQQKAKEAAEATGETSDVPEVLEHQPENDVRNIPPPPPPSIED